MKSRLKDIESIKELSFRQGYYCAVANLLRGHDIGVEKCLLLEYGKFNPEGIEPYDLEVLEPLIKLKGSSNG